MSAVATAALQYGLPALGLVGASKVQSNAVNNATKAQEKARQESLAYEREKQTRAEAERKQAWEEYNKSYQAWYQRYGEEGVKQYGVPVGITLPGAPSTSGAPLGDRLRNIATQPAGGTLGDMVGAPPAQGPAPGALPQAAPAALPGAIPGAQPGLPGAQAPPGAIAAPPGMPTPMTGPTGPTGPGNTLGSMSGWEDWRRYGAS